MSLPHLDLLTFLQHFEGPAFIVTRSHPTANAAEPFAVLWSNQAYANLVPEPTKLVHLARDFDRVPEMLESILGILLAGLTQHSTLYSKVIPKTNEKGSPSHAICIKWTVVRMESVDNDLGPVAVFTGRVSRKRTAQLRSTDEPRKRLKTRPKTQNGINQSMGEREKSTFPRRDINLGDLPVPISDHARFYTDLDAGHISPIAEYSTTDIKQCFKSVTSNEMAEAVNNFPWSHTPLGSKEDWPAALRISVSIVLSSNFPMSLYWGEENVLVAYNDAFINLAADRHGHILGKPLREAFPETWDSISPVFDSVLAGNHTILENCLFFLERHGHLEETYFTAAWSPISSTPGGRDYQGVLVPGWETTQNVIIMRRLKTLRFLGEQMSSSTEDACQQAARCLKLLPMDIPWCLIYIGSEGAYNLVASSGLDEGSIFAPWIIDVEEESEWGELVGEAAEQGRMAETHDLEQLFAPNPLPVGLSPWGEPSTSAVCVPFEASSAAGSEGMLIVGINTRRRLNDPYRGFLELVAHQLQVNIGAAVRRRQLEDQVHDRTVELVASRERFERLAKILPVGVMRIDKHGAPTYVNDRWWEITGLDARLGQRVWDSDVYMEIVHPDDAKAVLETYLKAVRAGEPYRDEYRLIHPCTKQIVYVSVDSVVELDKAGAITGFVAVLVDMTKARQLEQMKIDAEKQAAEEQRRRADEAEEERRQQDLMIDCICHEIRNPLSGVLNNADVLRVSLVELITEVEKVGSSVEGGETIWKKIKQQLEADLEAVEAITVCGKHQMLIADDILTMSKLNLDLLDLIPSKFSPRVELARTLRMFETSCRQLGIDLQLRVSDSYTEIVGEYGEVVADSARLAQIVANLVGNGLRSQAKVIRVELDAIASGENGEAKVKLSGTLVTRPRDRRLRHLKRGEIKRRGSGREGVSGEQNASGNGSVHDCTRRIFFRVEVADNGTGLSLQDRAMLIRFGPRGQMSSAAATTETGDLNPSTGTGLGDTDSRDVGGSGLGLFIAKRMVELMNGEMTVETGEGRGTRFVFALPCGATEICPKKKPHGPESGGIHGEARDVQGVTVGTRREGGPEVLPRSAASSSPSIADPGEGATRVLDVLIVEDNQLNQRVMRRQLEMAGHKVYIANHGREALQILESRGFPHSPCFNVILMDLEMPVMDGLECCTRIRAIESKNPGRRTPIVAVTGNARQEYAQRCVEVGMDDFVTKPYDKSHLLGVIGRALTGLKR